jgi:hypothetical protein
MYGNQTALDSLTPVNIRSCGQPYQSSWLLPSLISNPNRPKNRQIVSLRERTPGMPPRLPWSRPQPICRVTRLPRGLLVPRGLATFLSKDTAGRFQGCQLNVKITVGKQTSIGASRLLSLDGRLIHQHDRDVVFYRIHPAALLALQALRILPVLEGLLARRTNQNFQQVFSNHDKGLYAMPESLITEAESRRKRTRQTPPL